jgi:hypothetical protein
VLVPFAIDLNVFVNMSMNKGRNFLAVLGS